MLNTHIYTETETTPPYTVSHQVEKKTYESTTPVRPQRPCRYCTHAYIKKDQVLSPCPPHITRPRRFDTSFIPVPLLMTNIFFHDFFAECVRDLEDGGGEED